jgi:hypothetical protein
MTGYRLHPRELRRRAAGSEHGPAAESDGVRGRDDRPLHALGVGNRQVLGHACNPRALRPMGNFRHVGQSGRNRFWFSGRLRGRKLSPGGYRLIASSTDAAGNRSKPKRVMFTVLPPRR